jgi:hypothetical protein
MPQPLPGDFQGGEPGQRCNQIRTNLRGGRKRRYEYVCRHTHTVVNICRASLGAVNEQIDNPDRRAVSAVGAI